METFWYWLTQVHLENGRKMEIEQYAVTYNEVLAITMQHINR